MPKKLSLSGLKVKSFVTSLENIDQEKLNGGINEPVVTIEPCTGTECITCSGCTCPEICSYICPTMDFTIDCITVKEPAIS